MSSHWSSLPGASQSQVSTEAATAKYGSYLQAFSAVATAGSP